MLISQECLKLPQGNTVKGSTSHVAAMPLVRYLTESQGGLHSSPAGWMAQQLIQGRGAAGDHVWSPWGGLGRQ